MDGKKTVAWGYRIFFCSFLADVVISKFIVFFDLASSYVILLFFRIYMFCSSRFYFHFYVLFLSMYDSAVYLCLRPCANFTRVRYKTYE